MRGLVTSRTSTLEPWMAPLVGDSVRQHVVLCSTFISQHSEQQQTRLVTWEAPGARPFSWRNAWHAAVFFARLELKVRVETQADEEP